MPCALTYVARRPASRGRWWHNTCSVGGNLASQPYFPCGTHACEILRGRVICLSHAGISLMVVFVSAYGLT